MSKRILVAYASRLGSTADVARVIGKILAETAAEVVVSPIGEVGDLQTFDSVVLGSPVRLGRLVRETVVFARSHAAQLDRALVAYFTTGLTMREDTAANRRQAESYLAPLRRVKEPLRSACFGGKMDHHRLGPFLRSLLFFAGKESLPEGDFRDWDAVECWARELVPLIALSAR